MAIALSPLGMALPKGAWVVVTLLGAWAIRLGRPGELADAAILAVAFTCVATYATVIGVFLMPFPALLPILIFTFWRAPPASQLPWLRIGLFGASGAAAAAVVALAASVAAWITSQVLGGWAGASGTTLSSGAVEQSVLQLASGALVIGMVGGGAEEALFRGALQGRLTRVLGPLPAVGLQALAYAAYCYAGASGISASMHGGLRLGAGAALGLILGLLLGVLRLLSDGIFAPWIAHAMANVTILIVLDRWQR